MRYTEARLEGARRSDDGGHRQGDRRLRPELRRDHRGADGPADAVPEPAGQRLVRHRRRHGDEHPAAQPARGDRRRHRGRSNRAQSDDDRRRRRARSASCCELHPGPGLPHRRLHLRPRRHPAGLHAPAAADHHARQGRRSRRSQEGRSRVDRRHRDPLPGQQGAADREASPSWCTRRSSKASPTFATRAIATACASSSS